MTGAQVQMPVMDGLEAVAAIRALEDETAHTLVSTLFSSSRHHACKRRRIHSTGKVERPQRAMELKRGLVRVSLQL